MTPSDIDLLEEYAIRQCRESFWAFRQYLDPKFKIGWFQRKLAKALQKFYDDLIGGNKPALMVEAPPQHGKSRTIIEFIAWLAGKHPELKTIYTSFSERLGIRANLTLQRIFDSDKYKRVFPDTRLNDSNTVTVSSQALRNREILEYVGKGGYFRNTTVRGSITGESLDLGCIDDATKGREEANSEIIRDKTWDWFTDDFFTRFSEHAGLLCIGTRWHIDDPMGRLREFYPNLKVLSFKAIADEDEPPFRKKGEALFPEHKSIDFLSLRKSVMKKTSWNSLYQQNPTIEEGEFFMVSKFTTITGRPPTPIKLSVRYWDKGGTEDGGDYTVGVLMHLLANGQFYVSDVVRGQWSALKREQAIYDTAVLDGKNVLIRYEQEPGSGGKESAEATGRMLRGFNVKADKVNPNKKARAENYSCQVEIGNVILKQAPWNHQFIEEHRFFPNGTHDDIIDASSGAFSSLEADGPKYNHLERLTQM